MKYNVSHLLRESVGTTQVFELNDPPRKIEEGIETVSPTVGTVRLTRTNRGIVADATVSTMVAQVCSRCIADITVPLRFRVVEEYYPTVDLRTGKPISIPDQGSGFLLTEAHELDLTEPIRQFSVLEMPMAPVCREDCLGLCLQCGENLNTGHCECPRGPVDARLATLSDWLKKNQLN